MKTYIDWDEHKKSFSRDWNAGVLTKIMAANYGVHRTVISSVAKKFRLKGRLRETRIVPTVISKKRLTNLWLKEPRLSTKKIGQKIGCSYSHVSNLAKKFGLPPRQIHEKHFFDFQ